MVALLMADIPHFDLPFRFHSGSFVQVEEGTIDDVGNCVEAVLRCPSGFRTEVPSFGAPDFTFMTQPITSDELQAMIAAQEPRAALIWTEGPSPLDELIVRIVVEAQLAGGT